MHNDDTLFDRIGGREAIDAVVGDFYDRVLNDEFVIHHFEGIDRAALHAHQVQFLSAVTGGPVSYGGDDMREAHRGMGITDEEFDRIAAHLDAALAERGVAAADRERVLETIEGYRTAIVDQRSA